MISVFKLSVFVEFNVKYHSIIGLHTTKNSQTDKKSKDKVKDKGKDEDKENKDKEREGKDLDKLKDGIKDKDKEKSKKMDKGSSMNKARKWPKSSNSELNKARRHTPTNVDKKPKSTPISSGTSLKPHSPKYGSSFSKDSKSIHSNMVKSILTGRSHLSHHEDDKTVGYF